MQKRIIVQTMKLVKYKNKIKELEEEIKNLKL